ncbi:Possible Neuromedin U precursor [hydrothermal vent metagenome]|uniref:Possible Neuromedin U n=1 Tax=hydrothermal vent metagenome TaxID=652676 RepID=A0A1W1BFH8_9ZZZZ
MKKRLIGIFALLLSASLIQAAQMSQEEIAHATQNPLTAMYSVPIQNNTYFDAGPSDQIKNVANFQPVIPIDFSDNWTLVTRTILPVVSLPSGMTPLNEGSQFGLGDTTFSAFFTPKNVKKGTWMWGAGPVFYLPTATDESLGTKKWGAGPAGVVLKIDGKWVYGALLMNIWSFAGSGQSQDVERVNLMTCQPFVNYNLKNGWYIASAPIITANWEADSDHRWTVPLGAGVGKTMRFGKVPGALQLHGYYNVATPDDYGETWQMRIQVQFLFPR